MYLHILGVASAKPTLLHSPTAQMLRLRDKSFLIDCGEGTQLQMLKYKVSFSSLHRIFISHLHGDHCLGLPGLLSTMSLLGFKHPVHIYGPRGLSRYVSMIVDFFCSNDKDRIIAHEIISDTPVEVYSDRSIRVEAFALSHRVPTNAFIFREQPKPLHLNREMADFYDIPIAYFGRIKAGADYTLPDGTFIPNERLTFPVRAPYSYAFCSDTIFDPRIVPYIHGVDVLYHETTFAANDEQWAKETGHSTTIQAANIAKDAGVGCLVIGHYSGRYQSRQDIERLRLECGTIFPNVIAGNEGVVIDFEKLRNSPDF